MKSEDMIVAILKCVHSLLLKLSPDESTHHVLGDGTSMVVPNKSLTMKAQYIDIIYLVDLLYDKLHKQQVLLCEGLLPSVVAACGKGCPTLDHEVSREGFISLLRCCMIMLLFLEFDLSLIMEKCQNLIVFLGKLCPQYSPLNLPSYTLEVGKRISSFESAALHECSYALVRTNLKPSLESSFLCTILEVFIDEFLVHQQLRKHFMMVDYVSDKPEKLFVSHDNLGDSNAVLELISSHYLLTLYDEWALNRFIHSLFWSKGLDFGTPELTLSAALILLGAPVIFTAPYMLQAHIVLLASRCIGIQMPTGERKLDVCVFECYMSAFELSVSLYAGYMSTSEIANHPIGDEVQSGLSCEGSSFGSCIRPITREKLNLQTNKLLDICYAESHGLLSSSKAKILKNFAAYIKENQHVIDESCRDEACLILNSMLSRTISSEIVENNLCESGENFRQEMFCLAAVLKLMSSSLLQVIWFLRQNGFLDSTKTLKNNILCREYAFLTGIMCSFGKYSANQLVEEILLNGTDVSCQRHKASHLMLAHFASLFLYSFNLRLEFLSKGCIFIMMVIMNFLFFEEGNLDVLKSLLRSTREILIPQSSPLKMSQKRSMIIASNIQNTQMLYLREQVEYPATEDQWVVTEKGNGKGTEYSDSHERCTSGSTTCNGAAFVECLSDYHGNPSNWEDLMDFIECKRGKDYASWLKKRKRFRKWQHDRIPFVSRLRRKKMNRLRKRV